MRSRWALIAVVALAGIVAAGVVAAIGLAVGGGGGGNDTTSTVAYQATVVNARDRIDFAIARIGKSQSVDELVQRINDASATVGDAATTLENAKVASGFESDNEQLVLTLRSFSTELANTASTFSDPTFGATLESATSLSFPQWDKVNAILADMHSRGIEVAPLARH